MARRFAYSHLKISRVKVTQKSCSLWKWCRYLYKGKQKSRKKTARAQRAVTSHYKLLALHSGVPLGPLQQRYPVVHLLRRVCVAVEHPVGRDDHKRIGPEWQGEREAQPVSSTVTLTSLGTKTKCLSPGLGVTGRHTVMLFVFYIKANFARFCRIYFMHH